MQLINLYIQTVLSYSSNLATFLCLVNLTEWKSRKIPIRGDFNDGWSYTFHGSGCHIVSPDIEVDFEFDTECKVGGFDLWRLWSFVCDNDEIAAKFSAFIDKKVIQNAFESLLKNHLIKESAGLYRIAN